MTRPLSIDLRHRLVSAVEDGMSGRSAAKRFGVSASSAIRRVDQWTREGHVTPGAQGGDNRSHRPEAFADEILGLIDRTSDITLAEIAVHLEEVHGFRTSQSAVRRLLDRHGMTLKKTARASERSDPDVLRRRQVWFDRQPDLSLERPVFIDETGASTKMARVRGRARRENDVAHRRHGHWKTTAVVGAFGLSSMTAPMVLGAMNGQPSRLMASRLLFQPCLRVISSSWIIRPPTRLPACAWPLRLPEPNSSTCCPILPTSIPSKWLSQNSRHFSKKPPPEPGKLYGRPSAQLSIFRLRECQIAFRLLDGGFPAAI